MPPKLSANAIRKPPTQSRKKVVRKKQISPQEKLKRLFKSLYAQVEGGHFRNALKSCDKSERFSSHESRSFIYFVNSPSK